MTGAQAARTTEEEVAGKSTRITVDLGSEELVKALKIAAVERRRTVRDIVVEALGAWLSQGTRPNEKPVSDKAAGVRRPPTQGGADVDASDKDYVSMMETLNRYRGVDGK